MVRSLLLTFAMLLSAGAVLAQTILAGKVIDEGTKEDLIGASVKITKGGEVVKGAITDFNGEYRIPLDPGKYDVEVSYTGYTSSRISGVQVLSNTINYQNFSMSAGTILGEVVIKEFKVPLIKQDETSTGQALTSDQIKNLPTRSVQQIVATTAGTTSIDGGDVSIKGSRSNATNYYIDGIRVQGSPPPVQDLEQLQVITGGLGAEYGDVTGGVISLTTKGPASDYHGALEVENSHGLDPYGWLLATGNVSGPIVKKKLANGASRTVVGFRLSGQLLNQKDDDPPATPVYYAKEEVRKRLAEDPVILENGVPINAGEQLTQKDVDVLKYRPFEKRRDIDVTGKLDFRLSDAIDVSVTGTFKDVQNQEGPDPENTGRETARLLNAQNNPTDYDRRYRGIARFRHRLGGSSDPKSASSSGVTISNASYQLQFGFERATERREDPRHQERIFDYGYVGRYNYRYVPTVPDLDPGPGEQWTHVDYSENFISFIPGYAANDNSAVYMPNEGLTKYNKLATPGVEATYLMRNGIFPDQYNDLWGNYHNNINRPFDRYSKTQDDIVTILASSSFDLKLGRTGTHNIQFGLMNEQRTLRSHRVSPFGLWRLMGQTANIHFNGIDTSRVIRDTVINGLTVPIYAVLLKDQANSKFYKEVRKELNNTPLDQYVNVHSLSPDFFRLDMFSSRELTEQNLVGYYGYDYLGNDLPSSTSFNEFFTAKDADGVRTFPVAPLQPLYQAAYLKDKFTFNNMIFSLGFRVERLDLNTKVMRDPYSLYAIKTAKDYFASNPGVRPGTIGDDFKVYATSKQDQTSIQGFRDGDTWYFADGRQANDGVSVLGTKPVAPILVDTVSGDDIFDPRFNPDLSFEDYTPQVNWLPRLAFSFPISEDANFFAHYDVLVQRPPDGWQVTPLNYLYFNIGDRTPVNNANLRPERVVDYEVGFQQKLNQNSAIKFSAYYREMRDMIQRRTIAFVPDVVRYETYGNQDFGTVKGFTVQYDLRRIQNAELRLAYTLQFADGTGSDQNSQRGLTARGNIRTLYPLNFDERHNISGILDYRFASGKQYNGPTIAGKDILANFGVNLQLIGASGRPYSAEIRPTRFGGEGNIGAINGNRKPWRMQLDMRVDKSFSLSAAGKRPLNLNVYFRVSNLLNRKNVVDVYSVTGSPTDSGWLATGEARSVIDGFSSENRNIDSYLASYTWALLNPNNFTLPRRMYIGAAFEF